MMDYQNFIDGEFVPSSGTARLKVSNPSKGQVICTVPDSSGPMSRGDLVGRTGATEWASDLPSNAPRCLHAIAARIRKHAEEIAHVITEEQGKTQGLARGEVDSTADYIDYMAEWARRIEGEIVESDRPGETIFVFRKPIGVVAGILPWNFPFFLIGRKAATALVTGNTIVIKPSVETPHNAVKFCEMMVEAGVPAGLINFVHGRGRTVGKALVGSSKIGMVTLTGSVEAGAAVMAAAAPNVTKVNLELGGKAPALVMADADIDLAVEAIKASRVINSGQVCTCCERVYVQRKVADEFVTRMTAAMGSTHYGDPLADPSVEYGPMINETEFRKVDALVHSAVQAGATVTTGGRRGRGDGGFFYEPTVLTDVKQEMEIIRREIFGPVLPIVTFDDMDEAVEYANDSDLGLSSSIYTRDLNIALQACQELRCGETYINRENEEAFQGFHAGWRKSGIGGADGKHGLYEFLETHVVYAQRQATN